MPAIRAFSWNYTTSTTGTTLTIPLPAYVAGDLLLAVFMADTGTGSWTCTGWAHITGSPTTNTCQLVCMWKIAEESEPDPTFTRTVAETFNGCIISIRDVDTTNPFGSPTVQNFATQAAAAKFNMQTIATNRDNTLVIYASANSGVGVPSLLEGPVFGLLGADGTAESLGIGWGIQAAAGATPNNVGVSNVATGAGVKLVLQVAPPSAGATVIPAYCAADASIYINPIHGVTAYNGNSAMAATADTNFGTTLGGLTAADATVAAIADVGINSFHSAARVTSISGSLNLAGVELVLATANRPNVSGKNVLFHVSPSTAGQLQRYSSVASGRGMWAGMRSAVADNMKIWQVHGVELGAANYQPIIINAAAGNTKHTAGTLDATGIWAFGFWTSGTGITTTIWDFMSLWALDTVTICGGNQAGPVEIPGIVAAAATGKERRSVLRQGARQALVYQPIQLGNGGSSPIYLDLNATAIEFPQQCNVATAEVSYNSVDNAVGLSYYAGASDTIKHRNSVISSSSKYTWGFHADSSTSAAYDFSGLMVIGAGTVTLKAGITLDGVIFSACDEIPANGATLTDCQVNASTSTNAISVTGPAQMANITNCWFVGNNRAIALPTADTYNFVGLKFSGNTYDVSIAATEGLVTINVSGGGDTPTYVSAGADVVINNLKTYTFSVKDEAGIPLTGYEWRLYADDPTPGRIGDEIDTGHSEAEHESATQSSYTYSYTFVGDTNIVLQVMHTAYREFTLGDTLTSENKTVVAVLRQEENI